MNICLEGVPQKVQCGHHESNGSVKKKKSTPALRWIPKPNDKREQERRPYSFGLSAKTRALKDSKLLGKPRGSSLSINLYRANWRPSKIIIHSHDSIPYVVHLNTAIIHNRGHVILWRQNYLDGLELSSILWIETSNNFEAWIVSNLYSKFAMKKLLSNSPVWDVLRQPTNLFEYTSIIRLSNIYCMNF